MIQVNVILAGSLNIMLKEAERYVEGLEAMKTMIKELVLIHGVDWKRIVTVGERKGEYIIPEKEWKPIFENQFLKTTSGYKEVSENDN